jgi:serine/threonine protein kinase
VVQRLIGEMLGHYRILQSIEQGGMASVFLARDIHLQREVAIKVFQPQKDQQRTSEFFRRFTREAQIVARLDHSNILQVYDYGEQEGLAYLVMPYLANGSLKHLLAARGPLPVPDALHLIYQLLDALQYAHDQGLIHRDIKPGNILFKNSQTPVLADFGLVKEIATGETLDTDTNDIPPAGRPPSLSSSFVMGTPYYMAPEQIRGQVQPASDIYSLGLVLYEMLTGQHPYTAATTPETFNIFLQQLYEPPRPIRDLNPDIPPQLAQVIMHALEKDAIRRYQRPADFLLALRAVAQQLHLNAAPAIDQMEPRSTLTSSSDPAMTLPVPTEQLPSTSRLPFMERLTLIPGSNPPQHQHMSLSSTVESALTTNPQRTAPRKSFARLPMSIIGVIVLITLTLAGVAYFAGPGFALPLITQINSASNGHSVATVKPGATAQPTRPAVTQAMPPTQTSCPPAGTARSAVMAPYASQGQTSVFYTITGKQTASQEQTLASASALFKGAGAGGITRLMRYNVVTGKANPVFFFPSFVYGTQISADGQWVIFSTLLDPSPGSLNPSSISNALSAIQMIRIDGQGLQTLYCSPRPEVSITSDFLVSPDLSDQHWHLMFYEMPVGGTWGPSTIAMLDIKTGELVRKQTTGHRYKPISWINDEDVYLLDMGAPGQNPADGKDNLLDLAIDTTTSPVTLAFHDAIAHVPALCSDLTMSPDLKTIYTSQCKGIGISDRTCGGCPSTEGPSSVETTQESLDGSGWSKPNPLYTSSTMAIISVRAITSSTLLLLVGNNDQYKNQNGLWEIKTDGTGLQRLTTESTDLTMFNDSSQSPWSNVSRDGSMYAFKTGSLQALGHDKLFIGSLSGGQPTAIAVAGMGGIDQQAQLNIVGWTTF